MKLKCAYIDHSFHTKTKSTLFFQNLISNNFKTTFYWDTSWEGTKNIDIKDLNKGNYDYIVFFQTILTFNELNKLKANIIWVPMYDSVVGFDNFFWKKLATLPIKIISFSKALSIKAQKFGIETLTVQYFLNPAEFPLTKAKEKVSIFFWQRTNFSFNEVKRLVGDQHIDQIVLKLDPDPGFTPVYPSEDEITKYNIKILEGSVIREEYIDFLRQSTIFISPRAYEGIGMSFIEAMTMGIAVIAPDNPTMNEYIGDNKNGYLFNYRHLETIDLSNHMHMGEVARNTTTEGFNKWLLQKKEIVSYITQVKHPSPRKTSPLTLISYWFWYRMITRSYRRIVTLF